MRAPTVRNLYPNNLVALIEAAGITKAEFARRAGMSPVVASPIIQGRKSVLLQTAFRIAEALGKEVSEVFPPDLVRRWPQ